MNWKKNILYIISLGCIAGMGGFLHVGFAADFGFGPDISGIEATEDVLVQGTSDNQEENIIDIVKSIVNIVLGVLALIALLFLMRGGFQMVTAAGNEDRYKKGWTILRTAAVGLFFIGLAWFFLSLVFRLIVRTTESAVSVGIDE